MDGIGFIMLYHVFTAHMSGNSIAAAVHFGRGESEPAWHRAFPIPTFVFGVIIGAALCEGLARRRIRSVLAAAFGLETLLLIAFLLVAQWDQNTGGIPRDPAWRFYAVASLPAVAMGVQNAALRRVGAVKVRTTYITGMLTNAAEEATSILFWIADRSRGRVWARFGKVLRVLPRRESFHDLLLFAGIWLAYVGGGAAGAWAEMRIGLTVWVAPIAGLAAVVLWDLVWPISLTPPPGHKPDWKMG